MAGRKYGTATPMVTRFRTQAPDCRSPENVKFGVLRCLRLLRLYNKIPRSCFISIDMYLLPVLEAGRPGSKCQQGWFLVKHLTLACQGLPSPWVLTWSFLCVHKGDERDRGGRRDLWTLPLCEALQPCQTTAPPL